MKRTLTALLLLSLLSACTQAQNDPYSYYDQQLSMYYWSKSCSATLCNPR